MRAITRAKLEEIRVDHGCLKAIENWGDLVSYYSMRRFEIPLLGTEMIRNAE